MIQNIGSPRSGFDDHPSTRCANFIRKAQLVILVAAVLINNPLIRCEGLTGY